MALFELAGFLQTTTGYNSFCRTLQQADHYVHSVGHRWPHDPRPAPWLTPPEYLSEPVVSLGGNSRTGKCTEILRREILACWKDLDTDIDWNSQAVVEAIDWTTEFYDKMILNGTSFATHASEKNSKSKKSTIAVNWYAEGSAELQKSCGVLRKIFRIQPFPDIKTKCNGLFIRAYFYNLTVINDMYVIGKLDEANSEIRPLFDVIPHNLLRIPYKDDTVAIIDQERQYV